MIRNKARISALATPFIIILEVIANEIRQEEEIKDVLIRKKEVSCLCS